ncbi:MAG: leucyl aminopeptidase [Candidatus Liptonbacteria bacterium]|nr:leucyl aminopeptidase [Candidatus Liptonbacteria bacterium]
MQINVSKKIPGDAVSVCLIKEDGNVRLHPFFALLDGSDKDYFNATLNSFPKSGECTRALLLPSGKIVLLLGVAPKAKFTNRKAILAARRVIVVARKEKFKKIAAALDDFRVRGTPQETGLLAAMQFEIANFEFVKYKTPPKEGWAFVESITLFSKSQSATLTRAVQEGKIIGEEMNETRILSNTPGGDMTPSHLAEAATEAGKRAGFKVSILDEKEIAKLGMGGILGVSKGSSEKPRFIVMEYLKGRKGEQPTVLVGKGVTFDTGGLNLKPEQGIYEMHMDMSGGAAVIHTIAALARIKAKKNVIGIIPAVENMPSGSSYRPGDVLKSMSGKTIEVLNTDAEGRIILADALEYAKRFSPRLVVDIATLTGAAVVALGQRATALFSTNEQTAKAFRIAGEATGDFVWPLPLWEEYEDDVRGTFGDVSNTGKNRYGGAINGAVFLRQFIRNADGRDAYSWVHLDIAPRMTTIEGEFLAKGAAGASVALLTHFLRKF